MEASMSKREQTKPMARVAVVAIHGVADQQPGNTAHRISNLLLMHRPQAYTGFVETDLRIGVQKVHMGQRTEEEADQAFSGKSWRARAQRVFQKWSPRSKSMQRARQQAIQRAQGDTLATPPENFQHSYMREQLRDYQPEGNDTVYESIRLGGACLPPPADEESLSPQEPRDVHIFEMYWADLSRAAGGLHRLLVEFYLLLFFLCSLGRHSIEFARVRFAKAKQAKWWERFAGSQICAEGLLVLAMPILNLCLLGLGATMLPKHLDKLVSGGSTKYPAEFYYELAANLLAAMVALAVTGWLLYRKREQWSEKRPWPFSILALAGGSALIWFLFDRIFGGWNPLVRLSGLVWVLAAAAILAMMRAYRKRKPGALAVTAVALLFVSAVLFGHPQFRPRADVHDLLDAIMFAGEATFVALCLCWLTFCLSYWGLCVAGFFAVRSVKDEDEEARKEARRVRWTVHLTLVLPAVVMGLANVVLWRSLLSVLERFIPDDGKYYYPELLGRWLNGNSLVKFAEKMLELTAGPYFTYAYVFLAIVTAIFLWALLPVLLTELRVPPPKETEWLGLCLDRAYKVALAPGVAMACVIAFTPFLYVLTYLDPHYDWVRPAWMRDNPGIILTVAGSCLVLIVLGSKLPFKAPGKVLRNTIDIALDITNWLRLNPKQTNPKARISARFVSLLRHLHNWRDPDDGSAYAGIVIIAHSQGTVIAAEVLRFIAEEASAGARDPLLKGFGKDIPIYLFTMGSPLRQLYGLRFPHHYGWARQTGQANGARMPDPGALLVAKWVNVYRSADYVGRHLWRNDTGADRWKSEKFDVDAQRREWCLGAGAHNHYWDETAKGVAEELDALIAEAAAKGPPATGRGVVLTRETGI
jgi:hypothetical protein